MAKGPRKLRVTFDTPNLTHYGGVYLLHRFLTRIGLKHALAMELRIVQRNNRYSVGEMLLALLYPMFLGLERIEMTSLLRENGVFQSLGCRVIPIPQHCGDFCSAPLRRHLGGCALCTIASFVG